MRGPGARSMGVGLKVGDAPVPWHPPNPHPSDPTPPTHPNIRLSTWGAREAACLAALPVAVARTPSLRRGRALDDALAAARAALRGPLRSRQGLPKSLPSDWSAAGDSAVAFVASLQPVVAATVPRAALQASCARFAAACLAYGCLGLPFALSADARQAVPAPTVRALDAAAAGVASTAVQAAATDLARGLLGCARLLLCPELCGEGWMGSDGATAAALIVWPSAN